jgi:hypothetical protein
MPLTLTLDYEHENNGASSNNSATPVNKYNSAFQLDGAARNSAPLTHGIAGEAEQEEAFIGGLLNDHAH